MKPHPGLAAKRDFWRLTVSSSAKTIHSPPFAEAPYEQDMDKSPIFLTQNDLIDLVIPPYGIIWQTIAMLVACLQLADCTLLSVLRNGR